MRSFRTQAPALLTELAAHLARSDLAAASAALHTLKGVAATVGASGLAAWANQWEQPLRQKDATVVASIAASRALDEGQRLFSANLERLDAMADEHSSPTPAEAPVTGTVADWHQELTNAATLMEAGNLRAATIIDALRARLPEGADPQFDRLVQQVEALDFAAASLTARSLLARPG